MTEYQQVSKKEWFFPDAFLPDISDHISHEAVCVLNLGDADAQIELILYYEDRAPLRGFFAACPAMRTNHIRMDRIRNRDGEGVPQCVPYAIRLLSDVPVLCQYTRVDAVQGAALMTSMGL